MSLLGFSHEGDFGVAAMDHVATTEHVTDSGVVLVTWLLVATEGRSVLRVGAEAVAPAVGKCGETTSARGRRALGGSGSDGSSSDFGKSRGRGRVGRLSGGTSESGSASGEVAEAVGVGSVEFGLEAGDVAVGIRDFAPILEGVDELAGVFEVSNGGSDGGGFGDGISSGGKKSAGAELEPEIFDGLLSRPGTIERLEIGGEIVGGDGAVGGVEMGEEGQSGDIGEAEVFVAQLVDVG